MLVDPDSPNLAFPSSSDRTRQTVQERIDGEQLLICDRLLRYNLSNGAHNNSRLTNGSGGVSTKAAASMHLIRQIRGSFRSLL